MNPTPPEPDNNPKFPGVKLFRLSDADPEELTSGEELDAAIEVGGDSSSGEIAIMRVYEEGFGEAACATVKEFTEALGSLSDVKRLHLHINSCGGGDVLAAQAIYCVLADFNPKKIAYIGSLAAGAATLIMCGCDAVIASRDSTLIVCERTVVCIGDSVALRKVAKDLETIIAPIVSVYKAQASR